VSTGGDGEIDVLRYFLVDRHLDPMAAVVAELGDDLVNEVPDLPGANSPYALLFHCCGMLEWWTGEAILGRDVGRDRDAEFVATGTVADVVRRVDSVRAQLAVDLAATDLDAPLRGPVASYAGTPIGASARAALLHALEELAQHHGHLELTRDVLRQR
jgi:Protein of unknown function (DUF664)